jgi:hypothetical protein
MMRRTPVHYWLMLKSILGFYFQTWVDKKVARVVFVSSAGNFVKTVEGAAICKSNRPRAAALDFQ